MADFNIDPDSFQSTPNVNISFEQVLYTHINRTLNARMTNFQEFKFCILTLECLLAPYIDKAYEKKIKKIKEQLAKTSEKAIDRYNKPDKAIIGNAETNYVLDKFVELMKLADRAGLMPARKITDVMD
jgi:hypothetical protein